MNVAKKEIIIEYIKGKRLSDFLEKLNYKIIAKRIGEIITKIHDQDIIHGDLTTSNMIWVEKFYTTKTFDKRDVHIINKSLKITAKKPYEVGFEAGKVSAAERNEADKDKLYFIDFGLAFHSQKIEDKAVDLHVLKQALEAKHFTIASECFKIIIKNYKPKKYKLIIEQLKKVESRGRYKDKY